MRTFVATEDVTEVDILQGAVADRAAALGVEAPIMKTLAALIRAAS